MLEGVKVLELGGRGPVPFAGAYLADHGADVIRIDRPPLLNDTSKSLEHDMHPLRQGKRSVGLDLRDDRAKEIILRLLPSVDIVLEGFRVNVVERLGLSYERCAEVNPRVVYGSVSGWGSKGAMSKRAGHDINYVAHAGVLGAIGTSSSGPVPPLNLVGDYGAGALLLCGVLGGLAQARLTGRGVHVNTSIFESSLYFMSRFFAFSSEGRWREGREQNDVQGAAPYYRVYGTSDAKYIAVGAIEEQFYFQFVSGLGLDVASLPDRTDPQHWPELRKMFAAAVASQDRDYWCGVFEGVDACVTPVLEVDEALSSPQAKAVLDGGTADRTVPTFRADGPHTRGPGPLTGQHTLEVLEGLIPAGTYLRQLIDAKVLHQNEGNKKCCP